MSHPNDEQLLLYADGESPARTASEIRSHLEACWQCRVELEELQNTVSECVRYRKNTLQRHLPPPPAAWTDIYRGFAAIDAALDPASFWDRAAWFLQAPLRNARRWAPVAATLLVVCGLFYWFRQTPSVQAAELLRKAVAAEDARPQKPRRIQIRTKNQSLTHLARPGKNVALSSAERDAIRPIQALLQAADYNWEQPLSAKSYQAWHDRLSGKQDEVIEEQAAYRIRTRTASGELTAATLTVSRQDLRPVEERFEFSNREWVEITELVDNAAPDAIVAAGGNSSYKQYEAPFSIRPKQAQLPGPAVSATIGDELRVLAALNRVGADLGDPIEVSRAGGDIVVTGVGIAPQRQQEISGALSAQSHVIVRFSDSVPAKVEPEKEASTDIVVVNADVQQLQAKMAEQIGGRVNFTQLAAQVLDLSDPMMSRAYALRRLAERFPVELEPELSAQDWQLLRSLQRQHSEALRRQMAEIDRLLRPALASVSGGTAPGPAGMPLSGAWQPATEELFQSARQVEKLLAVIFGAAAADSAGEMLPAQLLSSLTELRVRLDTYDRLSAQAFERSNK
jgi:hypothetical protein